MTTATQLPLEGYAPGIHQMDADAYHADRTSLSSSGARKLLAPSCPAKFKYDLDNPPEPKDVFDIGHAAHRLVLGDGPDLAVVDAPDWRSKAAREDRDAIRAEGAVPLLRDTYEQVHAMATAIRQHPIANQLFDPAYGTPEQSLFWQDRQTGVMRRARFDWLPHAGQGRLIIPDYKTARSAAPDDIERSVYTYGYHQQSAWYIDAAIALGLADDVAFVFVVQEKDPPYLVTIVQLNGLALQIGAERNLRALEIFRACTESGHWPGYSDRVELITVPSWIETKHEQEFR